MLLVTEQPYGGVRALGILLLLKVIGCVLVRVLLAIPAVTLPWLACSSCRGSHTALNSGTSGEHHSTQVMPSHHSMPWSNLLLPLSVIYSLAVNLCYLWKANQLSHPPARACFELNGAQWLARAILLFRKALPSLASQSHYVHCCSLELPTKRILCFSFVLLALLVFSRYLLMLSVDHEINTLWAGQGACLRHDAYSAVSPSHVLHLLPEVV